ncbi:MAG: hypothetical protein ACI8R9_000406, partial [Paraglaciecola sp.]
YKSLCTLFVCLGGAALLATLTSIANYVVLSHSNAKF